MSKLRKFPFMSELSKQTNKRE